MDIKEILRLHILWLNKSPKGKKARLSGASLTDQNLSGANLRRAVLSGANLTGANLSFANLRGANLTGANLSYANLYGTKLHKANLSKAHLAHANLYGAILSDANLSNTDLWRTNLSHTDLSGVNLSRVYLQGVTGNMKEIKSLQLEEYSIAYTKDVMQIGCERHSIDEWKNFSDEEINQMEEGALELWHKWKDTIFKLIEMSPAE